MAKKKKKGIQALPFAQRKKLLLKPCKTKEEFVKWIKVHLGLHLPDTTVSRYADTNPLDAIWEIYKITVLQDNPEDINELLLVAGRGSGKTLGMAIVELMIVLHDKRDIVHVGAVMAQATRCYDYIKNFLYGNRLKATVSPSELNESNRILGKANMSKSSFNLDGDTVTLEVLPCTLKACNGPHVPMVVVDEIDTVSGEGIKAFAEISGMLDSKSGKEALRVGISTRKSRYGMMNSQIENAEAEGRTVRRWTAFEFSEKCPDKRSGTDETDLYVLQEDFVVLTKDEFKLKTKQKQKEFTKYTFPGSKCRGCPAAAVCLGDAKKQTSKSPMLKPITDVINKCRKGADWALAQLMNLKPSVEGIIYREFDERVHVKSWNEMWKKLTGVEYPGECNHDMFVKKCHQLKLPCYAGIDWGWTSPSTVVYFFLDKRENVYIVKTDGQRYLSDPAWINYCKRKYHQMYRCQLYFPDAAVPGSMEEMKKVGLPVANYAKGEIMTGVQIIKRLLRIPGSDDTKIHVAKETCQELINEFTLYHFKLNTAGEVTDQPEDTFNHWLDALRYPLSMLLGQSTMMSAMAADADHREDIYRNNQFYRTPSAGEFAESIGTQFNEEVDTSNIGKIGTESELNDDGDDDDGVGGNGGFLWSL